MCGRFLLSFEDDFEEIHSIVDNISGHYREVQTVNGEVLPSGFVPVVYSHRGKRVLSVAKWGFPNFRGNGIIINARAESVVEKPMFSKAFESRRCLIPANGYYEWLTAADGKKTKYLIGIKDKPLFYMAGLYNLFTDKEGRAYAAVVVITTDASPDIAFIHDRMPVLLPDGGIRAWLDPETNTHSARKLLTPYKDGTLDYKTV